MSSIDHDTVSAEQDLRLVGPGRVIVPMTAGMYYSRQDPFAVRLSFDAGRDEPVMWTFGRELLAAALHSPQGIGDVRAWPAAESGGADEDKILVIVLGPPAGHARFEVSAAGIEAFLARTYELVPNGRETACLDLEAEIAELLGRA